MPPERVSVRYGKSKKSRNASKFVEGYTLRTDAVTCSLNCHRIRKIRSRLSFEILFIPITRDGDGPPIERVSSFVAAEQGFKSLTI
jgi:hypothetical protein